MNRKPRILVVGSFVMDQIASTQVFPNEGQTVFGTGFRKAPGGKGANQAVQAARLGAEVTMIGKLGRDANGEEMVKVCEEAGIDTSRLVYDDRAPSGCAVIILEEKPGEQTKNRIIVLPGSNMTMTVSEVSHLKDEIGKYDMVILQLEIPMEVNITVAQWAKESGVPVMLNPAPYAPIPEELLSCLAFISPNEHEAADMTGLKIDHEGRDIDTAKVKEACEALRNRGVGNVLVTLGESGAAIYNDDGFMTAPCAEGVMAVDPTAAGDSFVAAFSVGAVMGWSMDEMLRFANHTAALTVSSMGAMPSLPRLTAVKESMAAKGIKIPDTSALE